MLFSQLTDSLERTPVIAAVQENLWKEALASPAEVIFHLNANLLTVTKRIEQAHEAGKSLFVHMDLAEGIGKDRVGVDFLASHGVDGIISTRGQIIRHAKEIGLITVQRFFALDSQSVNAIVGMANISKPSMIEIMPGVAYKVISSLKAEVNIPIIAGGLIETQAEISQVLNEGAYAVSTSKKDFWK